MELWDAYEADLKLIEGKTLVRGEAIPEGMYHLVCDIIVKHTDGTYLLMQRDKNARRGGLWEASAGGSALCGETPIECAKRELFEETGINSGDFRELGRAIHHDFRAIYVEYLVLTDRDKNDIVLQKGETQAYKWVSAKTIAKMSNKKLANIRMKMFVRELCG